MTATPLPDLYLYLYGRPGCHLCDDARSMLEAILDERSAGGLPIPTVVERDLESDPAWARAFLATIPVIELGGQRLELITSPARIRRLLADTLDARVAPTP
jgi:Glutaredoxin-like domain (DUF836)